MVLKYSYILFTDMMLINSRLKPVARTNPLRNDSGLGILYISVMGPGFSFNIVCVYFTLV
ncbi:MAG TPA: hypothetical protein VFK40_09125 [Nitrososphaeraceae archaeon]|nr:hypothetical protein [Nitrososphaeraceae archaeon]